METAKFLETVVETVMETVGKVLETVFFIFRKRKGRGILCFNIIRIPWFPTLSQQFPQRFPQRFPGFHVCVRFPQDDLGTREYNVEGVGWCSASDGSIEMHLMAPKYNA